MVAGRVVDERAFDVDAPDNFPHQRVLPADGGDPLEPGLHPRQLVGNDRRQNAGHAVLAEPLAGKVQVGLGQIVLVEVNAGIAVDLEIDELRRGRHMLGKFFHSVTTCRAGEK